VHVYRLCRPPFETLDGEGARLYGGRWNSTGVPMVYASATRALAALEYLTHVDVTDALVLRVPAVPVPEEENVLLNPRHAAMAGVRAVARRPFAFDDRVVRRRGFTLLEILVVIIVIAILATLVAPNVFRHVGAAKDTTARAQMEILGAALDTYRLDNGSYPSTRDGLEALWKAPPGAANWRGPYLRKEVPVDPWGHPYVYASPGQANPSGFDLQSYGRDGRPGGEGEDADLRQWEAARR